MESDARVARGVNIAAAVMSGFGILVAGALLIFLAISSSALSDPAVMNEIIDQLEEAESSSSAFDQASPYDSYDYSSLTADEVSSLAGAGMGVLIAMAVGMVLFKVLGLIAGLTALKALKDPSKLGRAFGLAIAAAVVCVLDGSWISLILFVVSAVFISRLRKAVAYAGQVPPGGYQPPYGAQPGAWQQPQQPGAWQQPGQAPQQPQPGAWQQPQPGQAPVPQPGQPQPMPAPQPAPEPQPEQAPPAPESAQPQTPADSQVPTELQQPQSQVPTESEQPDQPRKDG